MPALIFVNGKVSFGHMAAGYLGLLLLGAAALAIGTFGSALARTQVLAAIFSGVHRRRAAHLLAARRASRSGRSRTSSRPWRCGSATSRRFKSGQVHLRDVFYYLAMTYLALFAATRVMEARRWR